MKKILICWIVIFSVFVSPVLVNMEVVCRDEACAQGHQDSQKQTSDAKLVKVGHQCCCHAPAAGEYVGRQFVVHIAVHDLRFSSLRDGLLSLYHPSPLLEPPSRA